MAIDADTLSHCHHNLILLPFTCCCPKTHQETLVAEKGLVPRGQIHSLYISRKVIPERQAVGGVRHLWNTKIMGIVATRMTEI